MALLYFAFVILLFIPLPRYIRAGQEPESQYLSKAATLPIKGLSVVLVFFRHFAQYITLSDSAADKLFVFMDRTSGQLIVTMFLFYSGFGIYESVKKRGSSYISGFLKNRFLPTWIQFAVCLCFFLIYDLITGQQLEPVTVLLSFTGWTDIGNSNWFMFVTFVLYLLIFISFIRFTGKDRQKKLPPLLIFTFFTLAAAFVLHLTKPSVWYDTILCFPAGMWFSFYRERIDNLLKKRYGVVLAAVTAAFIIAFVMTSKISQVFYCLYSVCFALLVVVITARIRFRSPVLCFFGSHIFSIYILQRIPMSAFKNVFGSNYVYFFASFAVTVIAAVAFDFVFKHIRGRISKRNAA